MKIASWNVNSIRARVGHVTEWLHTREPDVLLLQELKGEIFPTEVFKEIGYESVAVTQKTYNGVAVLSRMPIETVNTTLAGDDKDSHARFLETMIGGIRVVNVYMPNGNPIGSDKFIYKLAWMDRMMDQMIRWLRDDAATVIGGDFNVIPEDIDCHKPASWIKDALFQPEPRARYRAMLERGYVDAFRSLRVAHTTVTVPSSPACTDSRSHSFVRTNPCAGALGSSALARNHGKHTGIPPRIARPSSHFECPLRKSTSSSPAGRHAVTCAPCR